MMMFDPMPVTDTTIETSERRWHPNARVLSRQPAATWDGHVTYPDCQNPACSFPGDCHPVQVAHVEQQANYEIPVIVYRCGYLESEVNG